MTWFEDVLEFHKVMDCHIGEKPSIPHMSVQDLRQALEQEELSELWQAHSKEDLVEIADAIVDSIYVLIGRAISYGIDLRPLWEEVHKCNMAKATGPKRADGKRLKPSGWQPPQIKELLEKQAPDAIIEQVDVSPDTDLVKVIKFTEHKDLNKETCPKFCPKCDGEGWLWWNELDNYHGPGKETGQDDTKYSCDSCDGTGQIVKEVE